MIKQPCEPVPRASSLAETAMMMLSSETIMRKLTCCCIEAESGLVDTAMTSSHRNEAGLIVFPPLLETSVLIPESFEISVHDWDCLFHAVLARLKISASTSGAGQSELCDSKVTLASIVLECVAALDQLQLLRELRVRSQPADSAMLAQDLVTLAVAELVSATCISLPVSLQSIPSNNPGQTR